MIQRHNDEQQVLEALAIQQIIFDESDIVSLSCSTRINDEVKQLSILFSFKQFNDLLRFLGKESEALQLLISDKLTGNEPAPYFINLDEEIVMTHASIHIEELPEAEAFMVRDIQPLSFLKQARNLKQNMIDYDMAVINHRPSLTQEIMKIAKMYRYYKGLLELNFTETQARIQSGLENDKLFRLALHANL